MKTILLLLFPFTLLAQGKIWRNQSLKLEMKRVYNSWSITAFNMNACRSVIDIDMDGIKIRSDSLDQFQSSFPVVIIAPQVFRFRNATSCEHGSADWLTIDATIRANEIKKGNVVIHSPGKILNCDKETTDPADPPVATKLQKGGM